MSAHRLRRTPTTRIQRVARVLVPALALAVVVAGCGGGNGKASSSSKGASASAGSSTSKPGSDAPAPDPGYRAPNLGECYRMTVAQSRASVASAPRVDCGSPHNTVVAYVGYLPQPVTPRTPLAQRRTLGAKVCEPAFRRLAGGTLADRATSILTWTLFTPGQTELERGARWIRCDVLARSGNQLIPLPNGKPLLKQGVPEQLRVCQTQTGLDVSCSRPHALRVEAVYLAAGSSYPAAPAYTPVARARCKELMKRYGGYWQPPSRSGWQSGDRFIRCLSAKALTPLG
jgi:hypothetical protein